MVSGQTCSEDVLDSSWRRARGAGGGGLGRTGWPSFSWGPHLSWPMIGGGGTASPMRHAAGACWPHPCAYSVQGGVGRGRVVGASWTGVGAVTRAETSFTRGAWAVKKRGLPNQHSTQPTTRVHTHEPSPLDLDVPKWFPRSRLVPTHPRQPLRYIPPPPSSSTLSRQKYEGRRHRVPWRQ